MPFPKPPPRSSTAPQPGSPTPGTAVPGCRNDASNGSGNAGKRGVFHCKYRTPEGFDDLWMASDGEVLTELAFEGSRDWTGHRPGCGESDLQVFRETRRWLDIYFAGSQPDFAPPHRAGGLTPFRRAVADAMLAIPFGGLATYGGIAAALARQRGIAKMSAQAVGGAVGWNPLCLVVPCHRVVGSDLSLTGYGGGLRNKIALLRLEGHDLVRAGGRSPAKTGKTRILPRNLSDFPV